MNESASILALRRLPPPIRLVALQAAAGVAGATEIQAFAIEALELAIPSDDRLARTLVPGSIGEQAITLVLGWWDQLDASSRSLLLSIAGERFQAALERLAEAPDAALRAIAVRIPRDVADPGLSRHLAGLLSDVQTGDAAARTLMELVVSLRPDLGTPELRDRPSPARLAVLHEALAEGVWRFAEHRRKGVLLAVLLSLSSPVRRVGGDAGLQRLDSLLEQAAHPGGAGLRAVLRAGRAPVVRSVAWRLLTHGQLGAAALDRVLRASTLEEHEVMLRDAHLVLHPARTRRLRAVRRRFEPESELLASAGESGEGSDGAAASPLPGRVAAGSLAPEARRGLPTLLAALDLGMPSRQARAEAFLTESEPTIRFQAMHSLGEPALLDFLLDPNERIARSAAWRWSLAGSAPWHSGAGVASGVERERLWRALTRSPHPAVRQAAVEELARHCSWDASSPASRVLARRSLQRQRPAMLAELRRGVLSGDEASRLNAIAMSRALGLVAAVETELIATVTSDSPRAAAAAATALGDSTSEAAGQALIAALQHDDERVRANAIEARVHQSRCGVAEEGMSDLAATLIDLKASTSPRLRANALCGVARVVGMDAASTGVLAMLGDDRPGQRLSGAWLAERLLRMGTGREAHGLEWLTVLKRLANDDPEPGVRARAQGAIARCGQRTSGTRRVVAA